MNYKFSKDEINKLKKHCDRNYDDYLLKIFINSRYFYADNYYLFIQQDSKLTLYLLFQDLK